MVKVNEADGRARVKRETQAGTCRKAQGVLMQQDEASSIDRPEALEARQRDLRVKK